MNWLGNCVRDGVVIGNALLWAAALLAVALSQTQGLDPAYLLLLLTVTAVGSTSLVAAGRRRG